MAEEVWICVVAMVFADHSCSLYTVLLISSECVVCTTEQSALEQVQQQYGLCSHSTSPVVIGVLLALCVISFVCRVCVCY